MKRLQFGTNKCVKLHVGRTKSETLCKDLSVGGWKVQVETDPKTDIRMSILGARNRYT